MNLVVAIGNPQRGDDGVAFEVCRMVPPAGWETIETMELTPEMGERIAIAGSVVFIDADYRPGEPSAVPLTATPCCPGPLTHSLRPGDLVTIARRLFGFSGEAWLLRVPGVEFGLGSGLSEVATRNARKAAELLRGLLAGSMAN
jgi:hydrogenase maturation protease